MLNKIVALSVRHRFAVILIALAIAAYGAVELFRLPIDAVPDITNRQVQVTTVAPALSPEEIEQRVTYPLETALTGIPGLVETRSPSDCRGRVTSCLRAPSRRSPRSPRAWAK